MTKMCPIGRQACSPISRQPPRVYCSTDCRRAAELCGSGPRGGTDRRVESDDGRGSTIMALDALWESLLNRTPVRRRESLGV